MNLKCVVVSLRDKGGDFLQFFYNLNIIDSICSIGLRNGGYGCEISSEYCGFINYVDDIVHISGSLIEIQFMLDICYNYGC